MMQKKRMGRDVYKGQAIENNINININTPLENVVEVCVTDTQAVFLWLFFSDMFRFNMFLYAQLFVSLHKKTVQSFLKGAFWPKTSFYYFLLWYWSPKLVRFKRIHLKTGLWVRYLDLATCTCWALEPFSQ